MWYPLPYRLPLLLVLTAAGCSDDGPDDGTTGFGSTDGSNSGSSTGGDGSTGSDPTGDSGTSGGATGGGSEGSAGSTMGGSTDPGGSDGSGGATTGSASTGSAGTGGADTDGGTCDPEPGELDCITCVKTPCCSQYLSCRSDAICTCTLDCVLDGGSVGNCRSTCGGENDLYKALYFCGQTTCLGTCDWPKP